MPTLTQRLDLIAAKREYCFQLQRHQWSESQLAVVRLSVEFAAIPSVDLTHLMSSSLNENKNRINKNE